MNGSDGNNEQAMLAEVGRATARLIHDFKNQLGGLKLYAAYLKKRFAAHPDLAEGLEIVDKITQSINEMTENANLIGKLTRPIELTLLETDFRSLVKQVVDQHQQRIAERGLTVETILVEDSTALQKVKLDSQQMLQAVDALVSRAVGASPENGRMQVNLQNGDGEARLSIVNESEALSDEQHESLFQIAGSERMNKTSLNLALARRIVEAHGGQLAAMAAADSGLTGTEVRLTIRT
jgi:signal transduction histidine kinase